MKDKLKILILLILIIIFILLIINSNYKSKNTVVPHLLLDPVKNLKNLYNNIDYDKYGIPNGGFLVSMLNTYIICPNYKTAGPCDKVCSTTLDLGDIDNLMKITSQGINKKGGAGTNCLSLDTTYFRNDLSPYAFGPLPNGTTPSQDFVIGIIIDVKKIWQYIACMYTIDSGSIARYNDNTQNIGSFKICNTNDKDCWTNYLNSNNSKYLGFAGCGNFDNKINNSKYLSFSNYRKFNNDIKTLRGLNNAANNFFVNNKTRKFFVPTKQEIKNFAWDNNKNIQFSKFQWKEWIENTKKINKLTRNKEFIELQCKNNDGYRENEVDIIVPSKLPFMKNPPCNTTDEFKKIWKDSIIGIFTNAKTNCSTKIGSSCYRCDGECCCNQNYHINVVKQLVKHFNKINNKNINGFIIDTLNINNFNSNTNLNISLID